MRQADTRVLNRYGRSTSAQPPKLKSRTSNRSNRGDTDPKVSRNLGRHDNTTENTYRQDAEGTHTDGDVGAPQFVSVMG